jgi:ribosome-binding protein aMBF1 (putative translation factor)
MAHQDWNTVTFNKPKPAATSTPTIVPVNHTQPKVRLDADGQEISNIKYVTKDMAKIISESRTSQKLSQKELATKCNVDSKIINEIERGGCVYVADHVNKIARALNVKIPREFPK